MIITSNKQYEIVPFECITPPKQVLMFILVSSKIISVIFKYSELSSLKSEFLSNIKHSHEEQVQVSSIIITDFELSR